MSHIEFSVKDFVYSTKFILITMLLYVLHFLIVKQPALSIVIGFVEFLICISFVLKNRLDQFYIYSLIFVSTSFDIPAFVYGEIDSQVYSILFLPGLGYYHFYFLVLFIGLILLTRKKINVLKIKREYPKMYFFVKYTMILFFLGTFVGILGLMLNDNDILNINYMGYYISDFFRYSLVAVYSLGFSYLLIDDKTFYLKLKEVLGSFLIASVLSAVISLVLGFRGIYGYKEIIMMPLPLYYSLAMIYFFFFYKKHKKIMFVLVVAFLLISVKFSSPVGGKLWLSILIVLFSVLYLIYVRNKKIFIGVVVGLAFLMSSVLIGINSLMSTNDDENMFAAKLTQVYLLMSFANNDDWYKNLPQSPKVRVEEFINLVEEYKEKPYFSLFGKGFGGSIQNHIQVKEWKTEYAFSLDQYNNNSFVLMHESLNVLFLKSGLLGIIFFLSIVKISFYNATKSPWLLVGGFWFLFFFGYSVSLALFGIPSLVLGLYELDKNKNRLWLK